MAVRAKRAVVLAAGFGAAASAGGAQDSSRVTIILSNRTLLAPEGVVDGLKIQPSLGVDLRLSRGFALRADAQTVDNSGPGRQGPYIAKRALGGTAGSGNFLQEITLGGRGVPWFAEWLQIEATISMSRRSYVFIDPVTLAAVTSGNRSRPVPTFAVEWFHAGSRVGGGIGMVTAVLASDDGMYFQLLPGDTLSRFGRMSGLQAQGRVALSRHLGIAGRILLPFEGANTVSRTTGRPVRVPVFDAALRFRVNPAVQGELLLSNALGGSGALGLLGDREYVSLGGGVLFVPGRAAGLMNSGHTAEAGRIAAASTMDGTPIRHTVVRALAGTAGTAVVLHAPLAPGLAIAVFADGLRGTTDESEVGASLGLVAFDRRRTQIELLGAASHTNNVFVNYLLGTADAHRRLGLRERPIRFGRENEREGEIYLITGGVTVRHEANARLTMWGSGLATIGQRSGRLLNGVVVGARGEPRRGVHGVATLGLTGHDNRVDTGGARRVPVWRVGLSWHPASWVALEASGGNRIGESPFHTLRARSGGEPVWQLGVAFGPS